MDISMVLTIFSKYFKTLWLQQGFNWCRMDDGKILVGKIVAEKPDGDIIIIYPHKQNDQSTYICQTNYQDGFMSNYGELMTVLEKDRKILLNYFRFNQPW